MILGIDASNAGSGGINNYLRELLKAAQPEKHGFTKVVVWAPSRVLKRLPEKSWLEKQNHPFLEKGLIYRQLWQKIHLTKALRQKCDLLYSPGGIYLNSFRPYVVCCMNMLPFEKEEKDRFGMWTYWRFKIERIMKDQLRSFKKATGVIFLSNYAYNYFTQKYFKPHQNEVIAFGAKKLYFFDHKEQLAINAYDQQNPFKILYISPVSAYKHQWILAEAIAKLRKKGHPIELNLSGRVNFKRAGKKLEEIINQYDPDQTFLKYHGFASDEKLLELRKETTAYAFSSSCENLPTILIEYMSSGRPIACSNKGPMPDCLQDAGFYFDPTSVESTMEGIEQMLLSPEKRQEHSEKAQSLAKEYVWEECADKTFSFLSQVGRKHANAQLEKKSLSV